MTLAERIRTQVRETRVVDGDKFCSVKVSIGVTAGTPLAAVAEVLLKNVDVALYLAKEQGRDRGVAC